MGSKTSKNKPKIEEYVAPSREESLSDSSSFDSSSSQEEEFMEEPIDPTAKTVKVQLYKIKTCDSVLEAIHGYHTTIKEFYVPSLGVCVNLTDDKINVLPSKRRRNDALEYTRRKRPIFVDDMEYYEHVETEIPIELYEKIKFIHEAQKQIEAEKKELSILKEFTKGAPETKKRYTNKMIYSEWDTQNKVDIIKLHEKQHKEKRSKKTTKE